jgi:glycosyltransferase involved in cell wall biosynthesis
VDRDRRNQILFFRQGSFSHINDRVAGWLREQFPDCALVQIDVLQEVIKTSRALLAGGVVAAGVTYLPRVLAGHRDFRDFFYRTPWLFNGIRRRIARRYAEIAPSLLFTIQTQSLYDAGIAGVPHFLYTDHTHLANLRYPGATRAALYSPSWIALEKALYHRTRRNLVMSDFIRQSLIEDYQCAPDQIAVVGAAPNLPAPDALPDNGSYTNRTILFVGVDWERKGGPLVVEAFHEILKTLPDARLIIAGSSPTVDCANVEVLGRVPLAEISGLLLRSTVLALPSLREPQGVNAIESLMHRIPVVASRIGALPEMVPDRKAGIIVPPNDLPALAAALLEILTNPELARSYGEAGREFALANYSSASVSRRMGDAIRAALD